ncbi:16S rRNA (adenine(1518)-N(6)/adenine(1519)-N(6))-dimethyltransferase RsmA [Metamycoplasma equirhinis]|uniref:16S rRNA (adenine(1518)-N(6)/adenine(1519)-N(6))- dimethyltransferase RsmA n=1 Tax=Metamycoplasma equirhinis TaxID=92402 RepID=UPI0035940BEE
MIKALKSFGQNFLINKNIRFQIVESANIANKNVIEIGPGLGAITEILAGKVKSLVAYEIDERLYSYLKEKNFDSNVTIINGDFLESSIDFIEGKKVNIIGNIPYNITSPIIFKLLDNIEKIESATLMVQKEVADRIVASPNNKAFSKLSVIMQLFSNVKKLFNVKAKEFSPAPKVDSAVIKIDFIENKFLIENKREILEFVKLCFQFKRKMLFNNLLTKYAKETILNIFAKLNISKNARAEGIEAQTFLKLFLEFNK